jgi:hypothetical protein
VRAVAERAERPDGPLARAAGIGILISIANFFVFVLLAQLLGGDALNGHAADGRYYLADHGFLTEVGRTTWLYSRAHAFVVLVGGIVTVLLAIASRPRNALPTFALPMALGGIVAAMLSESMKASRGPVASERILACAGAGLAVGLLAAWLVSFVRRRT